MDINGLVPFFAINLLCFALAWLIIGRSRFYAQQIDHLAEGRSAMLDGLRGWLALSVFFAHTIAMRSYFADGAWNRTDLGFYGKAGQMGVSLFFMITGFLFWSRVLRADGALNAQALYLSRVRRIFPMYFVSVAIALAVVAFLSGFTLQVPLPDLVRELMAWFSFGYIPAGEINGVKDAHYIDAVYWTLAFEWDFYIALPLLAVLAHRWRSLIFFPVAFLYCWHIPITLNFIFGALTAILVERNLIGERLKAPILTPLPLAALAAVFLFPSAFSFAAACLLFVFFLFVVGGNSLFGLLASRASKLLGTVSYSIYLMHCIVLYSLVRTVNAYLPIKTLTPVEYWFVAAAAAAITVLVSAVTYRYVEFPFCSSKQVVRNVESKALDGVLEARR